MDKCSREIGLQHAQTGFTKLSSIVNIIEDDLCDLLIYGSLLLNFDNS